MKVDQLVQEHRSTSTVIPFVLYLRLILLTWRIWWAPNNASRWQMGFNSTFEGLKCPLTLIPLTWRIWWAPNNASRWQMGFNSMFKGLKCPLTLIPLTWRIWWAPNNASRWQMGFNSAFKGLKCPLTLIPLTWRIWWAPNHASRWQMGFNSTFKGLKCPLTLIPLTWRIWWAPNNASRWQMGFNSAFKGLNIEQYKENALKWIELFLTNESLPLNVPAHLLLARLFCTANCYVKVYWKSHVSLSILRNFILDYPQKAFITFFSARHFRGINKQTDNNTKLYLKGIGSEDIDSVRTAQDRIKRLAFVNTELIIRLK